MLTKKQYDDYRGIEQLDASGEGDNLLEGVLPEAEVEEDGEVFSGEDRTIPEIKETLKERGFTTGQLRGKRKSELIDML